MLTKQELEQITAAINDRFSEFDNNLPLLSLGMARIAYCVIAEHLGRTSIQPLRGQVDDEEAQRKRQAEFDAIIAEIKHVSMGGIMPRMNTWDAAKPVHMPKSQAIINRHQKTWGELAEIAGLRMDKKETATMRPVAHLNGTFNE